MPFLLRQNCALLLALMVATATSGQDSHQADLPPSALSPSQTGYTLRTTTNLVVLDVVVTDAGGNVVRDLTQSEFEILENKDTQKIHSFERPDLHLSPSGLTIHSTQELDRIAPQASVNIIVLDEFNSDFNQISYARNSLKHYFAKQQNRLDQPTMLIAVGLGHLDVLQDYTQDRQALEIALDRHRTEYPWQNKQSSWAGDMYQTAFATLMQLAEASSGHPGHKNMIWVGRGFPSVNVEDAPRETVQGMQATVRYCVSMLRDARVTLSAIDPAGLTATSPLLRTYGPMPGSSQAPASPQVIDLYGRYSDETAVGNIQFDGMVRATGGLALHGRNDIDYIVAPVQG